MTIINLDYLTKSNISNNLRMPIFKWKNIIDLYSEKFRSNIQFFTVEYWLLFRTNHRILSDIVEGWVLRDSVKRM